MYCRSVCLFVVWIITVLDFVWTESNHNTVHKCTQTNFNYVAESRNQARMQDITYPRGVTDLLTEPSVRARTHARLDSVGIPSPSEVT